MSLACAPTHVPAFSFLVDALGNPPASELARFLDVSAPTVRRWIATNRAPRAACLALFWPSDYGLSALDSYLFTAYQQHKLLSESLKNEVQKQQARLAWMQKNGRFDSANAPFFDVQNAAPAALPLLTACGA